uniref:Uncharacterized protein n=1 Tax=Glossina brevipalpis TaxID=37001 RepID=A0A1A9WTT6_9MUSC
MFTSSVQDSKRSGRLVEAPTIRHKWRTGRRRDGEEERSPVHLTFIGGVLVTKTFSKNFDCKATSTKTSCMYLLCTNINIAGRGHVMFYH